MKKYFICALVIFLLSGCTRLSPSGNVPKALPPSFRDYLLRQKSQTYETNETTPEKSFDISESSDTGYTDSASETEMKEIAAHLFSDDMDDYDKVFVIHRYLISTVDYDYENMKTDTLPDSAFTAEGALLQHSAVCEGYARAFSFLCKEAHLPELMISGTVDNGSGAISHAWNQVQVDGAWYNIDVTWDDPLVENQIVSDGSNIIYDYFLVPDRIIDQNHQADLPAERHVCTDGRYLASNRQLTIEPYLQEPYFFPSSDTELWEIAYSCLTSDLLEFQIVCDASSENAQAKMDLVLDQTQYAMEQIPLYGQISVNAQYGIADYVIVTVSVTPE